MHVITTILLILAGIILLILIAAIFMKKRHYVRTDIIIDAPLQTVFDYLRFVENQDAFNKHAMAGPDRSKQFKGTDGTVGYIYSWSGGKESGVGEKEIRAIDPGKKIEMEIRFVKPMRAVAAIIFETEEAGPNRTKVYWTNDGKLPYPLNVLAPMVEKHVRRDMASSLLTLRQILEAKNPQS